MMNNLKFGKRQSIQKYVEFSKEPKNRIWKIASKINFVTGKLTISSGGNDLKKEIIKLGTPTVISLSQA
jgi:hypothetical protein